MVAWNGRGWLMTCRDHSVQQAPTEHMTRRLMGLLLCNCATTCWPAMRVSLDVAAPAGLDRTLNIWLMASNAALVEMVMVGS